MINKKYWENFDSEEILRLSSEGKNLKEISKVVDIPHRRLGEMIKATKLDISKGFIYKVNDQFFDKIDCEEKAYLLGFFVADGCVQIESKYRKGVLYSYSYRLIVNNSIDDIEIIKLFQKFICPSKNIETSNNQSGVKFYRKPQNKMRWNSKHMVETLASYNIYPRKTYDSLFKLPDNSIPENLMKHFIRGLIDGDGHIGKSNIQITINSLPFLNQISEFFKNYKQRINTISGKTTTYHMLYINGGRKMLNEVFELLYKDATYYLTRKYNRFNTEVSSDITKGSETL